MSAQRPCLPSGPTFLGVGPEKTGTTWIYRHLAAHPDVWLPTLKELRYFWECEAFPGEHPMSRLCRRGSWHRRQANSYLRKRAWYFLTRPLRTVSERKRFAWDWRYLFQRHDDEWYLNCFRDADRRLCGAISPQYFMLPENSVAHAARLAPQAIILISLRRPDSWLWSFAQMNMRNGDLARDNDSLDRFITQMASKARMNDALRRWMRHFSAERIRVVFFDKLETDPWGFYCDVCHALGIDPSQDRQDKVTHGANIGGGEPMPDWFRKRATAAYRDDVLALRDIVDVPSTWL